MADETLRRRVYDILEPREGENFLSLFFDHFMVLLIVTNVIAIALESVQEIGATYGTFFFWFELVSVAIFTVEYVLRVWSVTEAPRREFRNPVKGRPRFVMTPLAVIDLIAILPFYLAFLIPVDLRFLRVFRLLRLFKLTRYSPALASVGAVLAEQRRQLRGTGDHGDPARLLGQRRLHPGARRATGEVRQYSRRHVVGHGNPDHGRVR